MTPAADTGPPRRPRTPARLSLVSLVLAAAPAVGRAQSVRTFTACTPDALAVCAELRLTAGPSIFELALRAAGAADATLPLGVYNLVLGTGAPAAASPRTTALVPVAVGGAAVSDASPWELFDAGDALFLSALTNRGVGDCVAGPDVGGFGQAARTCGAGQFVTFTFAPTTALFDPDAFTLLNLEAVALTTPLRAGSCGGPGSACVITADTRGGTAVVPEPPAGALLAAAIGAVAGLRGAARRRRPAA